MPGRVGVSSVTFSVKCRMFLRFFNFRVEYGEVIDDEESCFEDRRLRLSVAKGR